MMESECHNLKYSWLITLIANTKPLYGIIRNQMAQIRNAQATIRRQRLTPDGGGNRCKDLYGFEESAIGKFQSDNVYNDPNRTQEMEIKGPGKKILSRSFCDCATACASSGKSIFVRQSRQVKRSWTKQQSANVASVNRLTVGHQDQFNHGLSVGHKINAGEQIKKGRR